MGTNDAHGKDSCQIVHSESHRISRHVAPNSPEYLSNSSLSSTSTQLEIQSADNSCGHCELPSIEATGIRKSSESTPCSITSLQSPLIRSLISPLGEIISDTPRPALFDDHVAPSYVPGSLHLVPDSAIERLISRLGAVPLIRQLAEDLAHRDKELVTLHHKAAERERTLRKMLAEVEVSTADIEKRLAACSTAKESSQAETEDISGIATIDKLMKQAMGDGDMFCAVASQTGTEDASHLTTPKATLRVHKATAVADNISIRSTSSQRSTTFRVWRGLFGVSKQDSQHSAAEYYRSLQNDNSAMGKKHNPFGPSYDAMQKNSSRSSLASFMSELSVAETRPINHPSLQTESNGAPRPALKSQAAIAEFASSESPPSSEFLVKISGDEVAASRLQQSHLRDTRHRKISNPASPVGPWPSLSKQTRTGDAKSDLQRIIAKSSTKGSETSRKRTVSVSSNTGSTKGANSSSNWISSAIADRAAGIVPLAASQSAPKPDISPGPLEMETFHSIQPPTLIPSWNEHYRTEYLTDRFGFIYDKRQRSLAGGPVDSGNNSNTDTMELSKPSLVCGPNPQISYASGGFSNSMVNQIAATSGEANDLADPDNQRPSSENFSIIYAAAVNVTGKRPAKPSISTRSQISALQAPLALRSRSGTTMIEGSKVQSLLDQLSDLHDSLQRDKGAKWDEFIRRIRADRRRNDVDGSEMPEATIHDGELIGIATLGNSGKGGKQIWREFRRLVLRGIPVSYRSKIWAECSGASALRAPGYYEELLESGEDDPLILSQICMDVNRTLTDNIFFRQGPGVKKLKRVLLAYSRRNAEVGYCQGMNMIAASLLLMMPTDEDAFWVLVSIIENVLPKTYFEQSLLSSRADQQVLKQYVHEILPQLDAHLWKLGVELEALTFQWFLTIFTDCLAAEALYRVWDVLLCLDGSTFLFQTALALLRLNEKALLGCSTAAAVYSYLNSNMTHQGISIDGLIQASDALRQQVRKEDVELRRTAAVERELAASSVDTQTTCRAGKDSLEEGTQPASLTSKVGESSGPNDVQNDSDANSGHIERPEAKATTPHYAHSGLPS